MNDAPNYESIIAHTDLRTVYKKRREAVYAYLKEHAISACVFEDSEDAREPALRYLTGHPTDALLVLFASGSATLVPWDENLAKERAFADTVIPYTTFKRKNTEALKTLLHTIDEGKNPTVALSPRISFLAYKEFEKELSFCTLECNEDSVHSFVKNLRAQKDEYEIACTKKACAITSYMTTQIIALLKKGYIKTEADVALFAEKELRVHGCERTSFETLAAGPERSFAIHAFPGYTAQPWGSCKNDGTGGLSLLDYGVCFEGYASDCTITVARGKLSPEQEELLTLVQQAADSCRALYAPGKSVLKAAELADEIFSKAHKKMPHGLGHGTGLEIHEAPFVSMRAKPDLLFKEGNIVTLEPGLYDMALGGCRLENDILITKEGNEVLTNSLIVRLD